MLDLTAILDQHEAGDTISVTVIRYNEAGIYQAPSMGNSIFGYGFGYGYNGNSGSSSSGELVAGNGFEEITVDVTLEILDN